ncbi:hypothetical protein RZS08_16225, partial [Arthrospira platensis SPKY1]|nr:hypothetical protein [Arthrospira platensis SPKY1]
MLTMIHRNPKGYYYLDTRVDGKRVRVQLGRDRAVALVKAARALGKDQPVYTNQDARQALGIYIQSRNLSPTYHQTETYKLDRFIDWVESRKIHCLHLSEAQAHQYMNELYEGQK